MFQSIEVHFFLSSTQNVEYVDHVFTSLGAPPPLPPSPSISSPSSLCPKLLHQERGGEGGGGGASLKC